MSERIVQANNVDICTESFGDPSNPAILLMMGATASMVWWDEDFCQQLAGEGRYVIRYDHRDTGRSVTYEPGSIHYTIDDLADDAAGVLDAYALPQAHLVGMSLGGLLAQLVALRHPERVQTLTLMMSEPLGPGPADIPPIDEKILAHHAAGATLDWSDTEAVVDFMVQGWKLLSGSKHPFDETGARRQATLEVQRALNPRSAFNHAMLSGGEQYYGKLDEIAVPTFIVHGTEDSVVNYQNGVTLAREISRATLLTLEGRGHELHRADWDLVIEAIVSHTSVPQRYK